MKTATAGLALACALLFPATLAWTQTIDEVIERSITAQGGRAALAKLKSRSTAGTIVFATPAGELSGTIEVLNAAPNKVRTLVKADLSAVGAGQLVIDQRFDGSSGYVLDTMQGTREITGDQLLNLKNGSFPHPFLNYKDHGTTAKLLGKEKAGDREAFVVNFDPATGSAIKEYIDAETYLPIKMIIRMNIPQFGGDLEQTNEFSDYREVDGIKLPFRMRSTSNVQNFNVTITKVEHNVTVDQTLFSKPADK